MKFFGMSVSDQPLLVERRTKGRGRNGRIVQCLYTVRLVDYLREFHELRCQESNAVNRTQFACVIDFRWLFRCIRIAEEPIIGEERAQSVYPYTAFTLSQLLRRREKRTPVVMVDVKAPARYFRARVPH